MGLLSVELQACVTTGSFCISNAQFIPSNDGSVDLYELPSTLNQLISDLKFIFLLFGAPQQSTTSSPSLPPIHFAKK